MTYKLNINAALKRLKIAIKNKTLGCYTGKTVCYYKYSDNTTCVIGAMLPLKVLAHIHKLIDLNLGECSIETLIKQGLITLPKGYLNLFIELQTKHDSACFPSQVAYREEHLGRMLEIVNEIEQRVSKEKA